MLALHYYTKIMPEAPSPFQSPEASPPTAIDQLADYAQALFPDGPTSEPQSVTRYVIGAQENPITITLTPEGSFGFTVIANGKLKRNFLLFDGTITNLSDITDQDEGPAYQERLAAGLVNNILPTTTDKPLHGLRAILYAIKLARNFK
jgi:hypothetical protein